MLGVTLSSVMTPASLPACVGIHLVWYTIPSFPVHWSLWPGLTGPICQLGLIWYCTWWRTIVFDKDLSTRAHSWPGRGLVVMCLVMLTWINNIGLALPFCWLAWHGGWSFAPPRGLLGRCLVVRLVEAWSSAPPRWVTRQRLDCPLCLTGLLGRDLVSEPL